MAASQCPNCKQFNFEDELSLGNWIGCILLFGGIFMLFFGDSDTRTVSIFTTPLGAIIFFNSLKSFGRTRKCSNCSYTSGRRR